MMLQGAWALLLMVMLQVDALGYPGTAVHSDAAG